MITVIENFNDYTDWTVSDAGIVLSDDTIFAFDDSSLRIDISENMINQYFEKSYNSNIDFTDYEEVRFQIKSLDAAKVVYTTESNFVLSLEFYLSGSPIKKWYVPIYTEKLYNCIKLSVSEITTVDKIRFTILTNNAMLLNLDYMIMAVNEMEYDLLSMISGKLDKKIEKEISKLGSNVSAGSSSIELTNINYITSNSLIKISEGAKIEYHQTADIPIDGTATFTELNDGQVLSNSYTTNADVSLVIPASFDNISKEIYTPGFIVFGFDPSRSRADETEAPDRFNYVDNSGTTTVLEKRSCRNFSYSVQITGTAWHLQILQEMSNLMRSIFDNDNRLDVGGVVINYEVTDSSFEFGENEESPHQITKTIEFSVFEEYANSAIEYSLEHEATVTTNIL